MLGLSKAHLIGYGIAVLVIAGAYWRYTYVLNQRDAATELVTDLTGKLAAEKKNRATEQADRRKADASAQSLEDELTRLRKPHPVASVYCRPASVPGPASQGGSSASPDDPAVRGGPEAPLRDIGAAVDAVRIEQQTNAARQRALIEWERSRTH